MSMHQTEGGRACRGFHKSAVKFLITEKSVKSGKVHCNRSIRCFGESSSTAESISRCISLFRVAPVEKPHVHNAPRLVIISKWHTERQRHYTASNNAQPYLLVERSHISSLSAVGSQSQRDGLFSGYDMQSVPFAASVTCLPAVKAVLTAIQNSRRDDCLLSASREKRDEPSAGFPQSAICEPSVCVTLMQTTRRLRSLLMRRRVKLLLPLRKPVQFFCFALGRRKVSRQNRTRLGGGT